MLSVWTSLKFCCLVKTLKFFKIEESKISNVVRSKSNLVRDWKRTLSENWNYSSSKSASSEKRTQNEHPYSLRGRTLQALFPDIFCK